MKQIVNVLAKPLGLAFLLALFLTAGCAHTDDNMSERPWNTPKSWEHGLPTSIMQGR